MKKKELKQQIDELSAIVRDMRNEFLSELKELKSGNLQSGNDTNVLSEELESMEIRDSEDGFVELEVIDGRLYINTSEYGAIPSREQALLIVDYLNEFLKITKEKK